MYIIEVSSDLETGDELEKDIEMPANRSMMHLLKKEETANRNRSKTPQSKSKDKRQEPKNKKTKNQVSKAVVAKVTPMKNRLRSRK